MGRKHVYRCPMRWSDMDAFRHVNNVQFLRYLEEARIDWMFNRGADEFSQGTVVARHEIQYKRPLEYRPEPILIEAWVTRIGHASFTVAYEIRDEDTVYAAAESVLVPYNVEEARPRRITEAERDYLREFLAVSS